MPVTELVVTFFTSGTESSATVELSEIADGLFSTSQHGDLIDVELTAVTAVATELVLV